jgi:hypothetical protein
MEEINERNCLLCNRPDTDSPLIKFSYNGSEFLLCPEHMPIVIHEPTALIGKLPGAERMKAGSSDHD